MSTFSLLLPRTLVCWLVAAPIALAQGPTPLLTRPANELLAVLKSDAPRKDKADACRELAVIGTKDAVPTLIAMLADEKLSHMARYALETMPDPAVSDALRDQLAKVSGGPLVGIIGSLGVRRDAASVKPLAERLGVDEATVVQAAARALGNIATLEAVKALQMALPKTPAGSQLAVYEGLFRAAERLAAAGKTKDALGIYDLLSKPSAAPHQVRAGAIRGAIVARAQDGLKLLAACLRSPDYIEFAAAIRAAIELPDKAVTKTLEQALAQQPTDRQIVLIQALGRRADPAALPTLLALARQGPAEVRIPAVRASAGLADPSAAAAYIELLGADSDIARAAQESLASLPGPTVDAALLALLKNPDAQRRIVAAELIGRRRMTSEIPVLFNSAREPEAPVRAAAMKQLGELAGRADLPGLAKLLIEGRESSDLDAAEGALTATASRVGDPEAVATQLTGAWAQAQPAQKAALLRTLTSVGGASALKTVRAAVGDTNPQVRSAAVRALSSWKTADAAPELLSLAQSSSTPEDKTVILRGYLSLVEGLEVPDDRRLAMCQEVTPLIHRPEEKRLLLAVLGGSTAPEALPLIQTHLADSAIKEEACTAIVTVAERLLQKENAASFAAKLVEPLTKASEGTANAQLAAKAKTLLEKAQASAAKK